MEQASAVLSAQAGTVLYDSWYVWKNTQACVTCSTTNKCWSWFAVLSNWLILLHQNAWHFSNWCLYVHSIEPAVEHLHLIQSQGSWCSPWCALLAGIFHETDFIYIYLPDRLTNSNTRHLENTLQQPLAVMALPQRTPPVYSLIYAWFLFHLMPIGQ